MGRSPLPIAITLALILLVIAPPGLTGSASRSGVPLGSAASPAERPGELPGAASPDALAPTAAVPDIDLSGSTQMNISTNTTVGDITLSGNSSLFVSNASQTVTLDVMGNILLTDNARLDIQQSDLNVLEAYDDEYSLVLQNHSWFTLNRSNVESNGWQWSGNFYGSSNSAISNSTVCNVRGNWFIDLVAYNATQNVSDSVLFSDVALWDNPTMWNNAHLRIVNSSAFNIWPNFKAGMTANLTLPSVEPAHHHLTQVNSWIFPGTQNVTGINYSIQLGNDQIWRDGVHLWNGANVTLHNQTFAQVGFHLQDSTALDNFSGFRAQYYTALSFVSPDFDFHLYNVSIYSWGWFPFSSHIAVTDSDVAQIVAYGSSTVILNDSNYTGITGYLGAYETSKILVENTTVYNLVAAADSSSIELENSSVDRDVNFPGATIGIQATSNGTVTLLNSPLAPGEGYQSLNSGVIHVDEPVRVQTLVPGGAPAVRAVVTLRGASNLSVPQIATANTSGWVTFVAAQIEVTALTTTWLENYTVVAEDELDLGNASVTGSGPVTVVVLLHPWVLSSAPVNGTRLVPVETHAAISVVFGQPMNADSVLTALNILPSPGDWGASFTSGNTSLLVSDLSYSPATVYTVSIGTAATTTNGIPLPYAFEFQFTTAPNATVVSSDPVNQSQDVSVWQNVTLTFSLAMDAASTSAAVSITPTVAGAATVSGPELTWSHSVALAPATNYTIELSTEATSQYGTALAQNFSVEFRTAAPPPLSAYVTVASPCAPSDCGGCGSNGSFSTEWNLIGSATGGIGPYRYQWTLPNGTTETGMEVTAVAYSYSANSVLLIVTDSSGVSVRESTTLNVAPPPCAPRAETTPPGQLVEWEWVLLGFVAVVGIGAIVGGWIWVHRRSSATPPSAPKNAPEAPSGRDAEPDSALNRAKP
ncbi:MAG: Ig-like domain-containing protein [Thermoplasmata archaeon]|nr:Ig-like domain-containing protein [Thermoplasmata archaeon]